jgi:hypothetical protein
MPSKREKTKGNAFSAAARRNRYDEIVMGAVKPKARKKKKSKAKTKPRTGPDPKPSTKPYKPSQAAKDKRAKAIADQQAKDRAAIAAMKKRK